MTWALCLNCGELKFGAICPCPKCEVASSGDMNLDIAFSDHHVPKQKLADLGQVIAALHTVSSDQELCFWTFIRYIAVHHPSILGVELEPNRQARCDELLQQIDLPALGVSPGLEPATPKRWWQFWRRR
jgi:hypothetical protein